MCTDAAGALPAYVDDEGNTRLVAYCTHVDSSGRRTLLPLNVGLAKGAKRFPSRSAAYLQQGGRVMLWEDGALVNEPGLLVHVASISTQITACTGRTADPATSWGLAPTTMQYVHTSQLQNMLRDPTLPESFAKELKGVLEARSRPDYFHLVPAMREALKDEWPDPTKSDHDDETIFFIATPRPGLESDLTELLLESLADEAAAGDSHSRLLIAHIEAECGAAIS